MKITVIHGDDAVAKRARYNKIIDAIRLRGWDIIHLDSTNLTLAENFTGSSLFENKKLYVLEDIDNFKTKDIAWLKNHIENSENNLLIYAEGNILKKLSFLTSKNAKFEEFKLPKIVFSLLDSLYPGNSRNAIGMLHKAVQNEALELVFSLIGTTFRDLYWLLTDPGTSLLPPWRKARLLGQAKKFTVSKLGRIINGLADIDIAAKTSEAEILPLLDQLIASELE